MDKKDMKCIATKVSPEAFARLNAICLEKGITLYNLLQMFCDCAIRYMDEQHNLSASLNKVIRLFDGMNWKNAMNMVDSLDDASVIKAVYFIGRPGKNGSRCFLLDGDKVTTNVQDIYDTITEELVPSEYKHLQQIAYDLDTSSVMETLLTLADLHSENPDDVELRHMFETNDWRDAAQPIRHNSKDMERV